MERGSHLPLLRELQDALREAEVTEAGDLLTLAAGALAAFAQAGYDRVDHWEVRPGGWLPLHRVPKSPSAGSVGHLLAAMRFDEWASVRDAQEFAARLSARTPARLEFALRRVHRERRHSLTDELSGRFAPPPVETVVGLLTRNLPVLYAAASAADWLPAAAPAHRRRHRR